MSHGILRSDTAPKEGKNELLSQLSNALQNFAPTTVISERSGISPVDDLGITYLGSRPVALHPLRSVLPALSVESTSDAPPPYEREE